MTRTALPEAPAVPPAATTLDAFFVYVERENPFAVNRVVPSTQLHEDAEQVHQQPFLHLVELAGQAQEQRVGLGVLLWGEPGIGKSHLLKRLENWAGPEQRQAIFVYLANLQAGPEQLPRSLLRAVVSILARGRTRDFYGTPLYWLLNAALRHALGDDGTGTYTWRQAVRAYTRLVDDLCEQNPAQAALVDRRTYEVLFRFYHSVYLAREGPDNGVATLAVRWLAGDYLDPDEARVLSVPLGSRREEGVALADDEQVKQVLIALAQLAGYRGQPLILCLDQVDNLEPEQVHALSRFVHALLDSAANLLVVTSGVRTTLMGWEEDGILPRSTLDRLGQHEIELQRVSPAEARQIVQVWLEPFQQRFLALAPVRRLVQQDGLFPLGEAWFREFLAGKIDVRPRDVLNWARTGWQRQQEALRKRGGPAWLEGWETGPAPPSAEPEPSAEQIQHLIDRKVDQKLQEHKQQRRQEPHTLPPDAANLAGLLEAVLRRCRNAPGCTSLVGVERLPRPKSGPRAPYDLVLHQRFGPDSPEVRSGLLCLVVNSRTSTAAFLRRILHDPQPPERLFLVTDERQPLEAAAMGREYLEQLRRRHGVRFHRVELTFDEYAELDALQAVVGLARSGDLEVELPGGRSRRVSEGEVVASHGRRQRYLAHPLLRMLLTEEPAAGESQPKNGSVADEQDRRP